MSLRTCLIFVVLFSCTSLLSTVLSELQGSRIYPVVYKENCVFPFAYRGKSYTDCTIDGDNGKTPWCSMTTKYQGLINYCYDFRKTTLTCLDSFTMNNNPKVFTGCDYLSRTSLYKQCKTNDTKITYRYCTDTHDSPTLKLMDNRATCDPAYKNLSSDHTMCFGPNPYGTVVPFTQEEVDELLDVHNDFRNRVGSKYMFKLHWDVELAKLAQAHTNLCAFEHDLAVNRLSPKYNWKNGQNIVMATEINSSPGSLIYDMLTDEKKNFIYGSGCVDGGNTCLHYTQAMISNLTRMGCGQTHCVYPDRIERFVTCNYIQSQYSDNYQVPYVENKKSAVNCPSKIDPDTGLCDCGDKICAYDKGEYLDPNTCNCMTSSGVRTSRSVEPRQGFAAVKTGNSPQFMKRGLKKRSSK